MNTIKKARNIFPTKVFTILQGGGFSMQIIDSLIETFEMIKSHFPNFANKPIFNEWAIDNWFSTRF